MMVEDKEREAILALGPEAIEDDCGEEALAAVGDAQWHSRRTGRERHNACWEEGLRAMKQVREPCAALLLIEWWLAGWQKDG